LTALALAPDDLRTEAARIAFALLTLEEPMARALGNAVPPGSLAIGDDVYLFSPSWRPVPRDQVVSFLVGLPSPALLSPTTTRGVIALTLLHELSGDRRRWAEKSLSNFTEGFDAHVDRLGLTRESRIGLAAGEGAPLETFSLDGIRLWTSQFGVQIGYSLRRAPEDPPGDVRMAVRRSDGRWF